MLSRQGNNGDGCRLEFAVIFVEQLDAFMQQD